MRTHEIVCAVLIVAGAACAGSQGEEVRDARTAQIDETTVSKTRVIEQRQAGREETIERKHETEAAELEAAEDRLEVREDMLDVKAERAKFQSDVRARWQTIGVRINAAQKKVDLLRDRAPASFSTRLSSLAEQHAQLEDDVTNVQEVPAASWESSTESLDHRLDELNQRVKDVTDSIEDTEVAAR